MELISEQLKLSDSSTIRHVMWVPFTTAWRVLRFRMEETASRYEG